jgi:hypothetical protein
MWTTTDGYVLHLPRSGLMKILARLQDSGLNELIKDNQAHNLTQEVIQSVGRLAQNARRDGSVRHRHSQQRYAIFTSPAGGGKYQLLARPLRPGRSAILFVHYEPEKTPQGFAAGEEAKLLITRRPRFHPNALKSTEALQREAQKIFFRANPHLKGKVEVWHRVPLEWRRLFPKMNPNRLSNLLALRTTEQGRKVMNMWKAFREKHQYLQRTPTPKEVLLFVRVADRVLFVPPAVKVKQ